MITELIVQNFGVFEHAELDLGPGLTVVTGETGAGKSLVVGAIGLLLGGRSDGSIVRPGTTEARVDGRFVEADAGEVTLARRLPAEGRTKAYVDGRPATVSELTDAASRLVELHGQHAHTQLLSPGAQRAALDRRAGVDLGPLIAARDRVRDLESRLEALGGDERARLREVDLLTYQLQELDGAALSDPDEDDVLDAEETVLADADGFRRSGLSAAGAVLDDDGLTDGVHRVLATISGAGPFADIAGRLQAVATELSEVGSDLRRCAEGIEEDAGRLEEIRLRRQLLADLRRKYGTTLGEVIEERERLRASLEELESREERAAALGAEVDRARRLAETLAEDVAGRRRAAAPDLAEGIERRLRHLAMPHARVIVSVDGPPPCDAVGVLLAANPDAEPAPLSRVASGGELSRVALALRLELTAGPPTLLFDEVDAGIGGEVAWSVAEALAALAATHQLIVVTHLPQVAALADAHLTVAKHVVDGVTRARVTPVSGEGRIVELARMLSGQPDSDDGQRLAASLLSDAAARRDAVRAEGTVPFSGRAPTYDVLP